MADPSDDSNETPTLSYEEEFERIKEICEPFSLTNEQLLNIKESLLSEIKKGLKTDTNTETSTKCWPTYVQEYPCGCEHGMFLALEIRDHNFHISLLHLKGSHNYRCEKEVHEIPKELVTGYADDFFNHLVEHLKKFVKQNDIEREYLSMALCLSVPLRHTSLKTATVQNFNKNLNIKNLTGNQVVELLQDAINRSKDLRVSVETVLSNCTAILLANSWQGHQCNIGINIGYGFNAAYKERMSEIETCSVKTSKPSMIINTEWGNFGAKGHLDNIRTIYDQQVDELTKNKGLMAFEKLASGLYLGELARQIFLQCINEKVLFKGNVSKELQTPFSFTIRHVSKMLAEEDKETFNDMRLQFDKLGISQPAVNECSKVYYILRSIVQRSAQLVACGITCLLEKMDEKKIVAGLGGTFFFDCQIYESLIEEELKKLLDENRIYEIKSLQNGVALGSVLSAAISKSTEYVFYSEEMSEFLGTLQENLS